MRSKHSRSLILAQSAAMLTVLFAGANAFAFGDRIGGAGSDAQTIGHCGVIQLEHIVYTNKDRNVAILQRKLTKMGYYRGAIDGRNSPLFKTAVAKFQFDYGLQIDGVVGQETAEAIVYLGHPIRNVRACKRAIGTVTL